MEQHWEVSWGTCRRSAPGPAPWCQNGLEAQHWASPLRGGALLCSCSSAAHQQVFNTNEFFIKVISAQSKISNRLTVKSQSLPFPISFPRNEQCPQFPTPENIFYFLNARLLDTLLQLCFPFTRLSITTSYIILSSCPAVHALLYGCAVIYWSALCGWSFWLLLIFVFIIRWQWIFVCYIEAHLFAYVSGCLLKLVLSTSKTFFSITL